MNLKHVFVLVLGLLLLALPSVFPVGGYANHVSCQVQKEGLMDVTHSVHSASSILSDPLDLVFQRGMSYTAWSYGAYNTSDSDESLFRLSQTNTEWVAINVWWFQDNLTSTRIYPRPDMYTASNGSVVHAINRTHELGMKVMLKPVVDPIAGGWRGQIPPSDAWFASYAIFINFFAEMAETYGVELFCVGCEFNSNQGVTAKWEDIVAGVRARYSGPLTYAANHGTEQSVQWWDSLDYIGIDAYYPLTGLDDPTLQQLKDAWNSRANSIEAWQTAVGKPVIFTEIGYRSGDGANKAPWAWGSPLPVDLQEQADCYEAALYTLWNRSWFYGFYWWNWETNPDAGGSDNDGFTPQNKPAEDVMTRWYAKRNGLHSPTANFTHIPLVPSPGEYVTFNASASLPGWNGTASVPIANYTWDFDDYSPQLTKVDAVTNHTYLAEGVYNVSLKVTDTRGWWNTTFELVYVSINKTPPYTIHSLGIVEVDVRNVYVGMTSVNFYVTVKNFGTVTEDFTVAAEYTNGTPVSLESKNVTDLVAGAEEALSFSWGLSGIAIDTYIFTFNMTVVPGENSTGDNVAVEMVQMRWPGDANGDGFIGGFDATLVGINWWSSVPPAASDADFNGDGFVGGFDATVVGIYWWQNVQKP